MVFKVHYRLKRTGRNGYVHTVEDSLIVEGRTLDEALNDAFWFIRVNRWDEQCKNYTEILEARELKEESR